MAWVSSGTVSVTNGSTTVTGTGTSWYGGLQNGWGFVGPDGRVYEILTVDDATTLTLKTPYQGATASGQIYAAFPTGSLTADLTAALQALIANYQGVYDTVGQGRFPGEVVFDGDRDTGMGNPSSNEVALKAGGGWQLRLKGGQASGAAVQADNGDVAGDAKLVRMGGALAAALSRGGQYQGASAAYNIDDALPGQAGLVSVSNPGTWPSGNNGTFAWLTTQRIYSGETVLQRATFGYQSTGTPATPVTFERIRSWDGSAWSSWSKVYSQASVLGTVSNSGGTPTGAVIERGSNASGEYVRFADGTQICISPDWSEDVTTAAGALYRNATPTTWTFPASFYSSNGLTGHVGVTGNSETHWGVMRTLSGGTDAQITMFGHSPFTNRTVRAMAIGRWF